MPLSDGLGWIHHPFLMALGGGAEVEGRMVEEQEWTEEDEE